MQQASSLVARLLRLAWPVALARLGIMGMGLTDVMVVGQLAPTELPNQALGWAPTSVLVVTGIGLLYGVQVLAARALGEGEPTHAGAAWRRGMVVAGLAGLVSCVLTRALGASLFLAFGIAPHLAHAANEVLQVLSFSVPLHLFYIASAFFLEAIHQPKASAVVMWLANGVNLALNLALVPAYGAVGSAYATLGARAFLALALAVWVLTMREAERYGTRRAATGPSYGALLRVGAAAALSQAAEAGAFSGMTVIAGRIGEQAVAAYQVILNVIAVVFMIALGFSTATGVLTSEAVGRHAPREAARASATGIAVNSAFMLIAGALLYALAQPLARAYTVDAALISTLIGLFPLAAITLLPDGAQVVTAAALRAHGDNWVPTASHVLAYALAMPGLALYLGERQKQGVAGLLMAIIAASMLSASVLVLRLLWIARRERHREAQAHPPSTLH